MFYLPSKIKQYISGIILLYLNFNHVFAQDLQSKRPVIFSKPIELDWHAISWPSVNYLRTPIDGGAAIYSLDNETNLKFKINIVLPGGVYTLPKEDRPAFGAMVDLLLLGGSGNYSYDELENYTSENGINIRSTILANGQIMLSADALSSDFPKVIELLRNIILKPRFDSTSLPLWKQRAKDSFKNLLDFNTFDKQYRLIEQQANSILFGKNHYLSTVIERSSPENIEKITIQKVKELNKKSVSKNGLNVFLAGSYSSGDFEKLKKLITDIPHLNPQIRFWLPTKEIEQEKMNKIRTVFITKPEMSQSNISLRYYFPKIGKLNSIEMIQFDVLEEIFSSNGGIVGNDRFSKVLRAESGISYSPHAFFNDSALYPNTDFGVYHLTFQSPNERLYEAIKLATKTWNDFIKNGVTQEELDNTRTALMNRMLATELTVFNKADELMNQILRGYLPSVNPIEFKLAKLDKQKNLQEINNVLKKLNNETIYPVLIIMGNPSTDEISQIKKIDNIEILNTLTIDSLINSYLK